MKLQEPPARRVKVAQAYEVSAREERRVDSRVGRAGIEREGLVDEAMTEG